jgi:hypothetical protein
MTEEFRELEEFPEYKFGNRGTILGKYGRPMKQAQNYSNETYYILELKIRDKNSKIRTVKVHRLIAIAWIPNPENEPEIDHIDRNPANNCVENLRWSSRLKNANNMGISKLNKSGITGICFDKNKDMWIVAKSIMGVKYRKSFKERSDAEAYLKEVIETPRFLTE